MSVEALAQELGLTADALQDRIRARLADADALMEDVAPNWRGYAAPDPAQIESLAARALQVVPSAREASHSDLAAVAVDWIVGSIGESVRPNLSSSWPADRPFPLTDAQCAALLRGNRVRWTGTVDDFFDLPGRWELVDGYVTPKT